MKRMFTAGTAMLLATCFGFSVAHAFPEVRCRTDQYSVDARLDDLWDLGARISYGTSASRGNYSDSYGVENFTEAGITFPTAAPFQVKVVVDLIRGDGSMLARSPAYYVTSLQVCRIPISMSFPVCPSGYEVYRWTPGLALGSNGLIASLGAGENPDNAYIYHSFQINPRDHSFFVRVWFKVQDTDGIWSEWQQPPVWAQSYFLGNGPHDNYNFDRPVYRRGCGY